MRDQAQKYAEANTTVIGISFDQPEDNAAFRAKFDFPFALLSDPDRVVGTAYEALRPPDHKAPHLPQRVSYLIDPAGIVAKTYEVSDPAGHAVEVLNDLAELQ